MKASVVIRSKNEADRLRLVLHALSVQTVRPEVVVVDDGCTDHTAAVLADAAPRLDLVQVRHAASKGRSAASNAGAAAASGDVVIFLDGDTLAAPDFVERHLEAHRAPGCIARGEMLHLRGVRAFQDPETGAPQPGEEARVARMSAAERARSIITRAQIAEDFGSIAARAQPGIYPGFGPRKLSELEMEALRERPDCPVLWAAATGSNQSVARDLFLEVGGFNPEITINEHRELALRLCLTGARMTATTAKAYHLIHRTGWRDPLEDTAWERIFYAAHPIAAVALLRTFWESLADAPDLPPCARILSLPALAEAAARCEHVVGLEAVRAAHLGWATQAAAT